MTEATDELFLTTTLYPASTGLPMGTAGTRRASETPPDGASDRYTSIPNFSLNRPS